MVLLRGDSDDAAAHLCSEPFDLIGVSLSCDVHLPAMAGLLTDLRATSCNPKVRVLVGGPLFLRDPTCAAAISADATAEDGRSAVKVAEALFVD